MILLLISYKYFFVHQNMLFFCLFFQFPYSSDLFGMNLFVRGNSLFGSSISSFSGFPSAGVCPVQPRFVENCHNCSFPLFSGPEISPNLLHFRLKARILSNKDSPLCSKNQEQEIPVCFRSYLTINLASSVGYKQFFVFFLK